MNSDFEIVTKYLTGQGWKHQNPKEYDSSCCIAIWYKKYDTEIRCNCNSDKPGIQIGILCYSHAEHGYNELSFAIDLRGETKDEKWVQFQIYSLVEEDITNDLDKHTNKLIRAWEAAQIPLE